MKLFAQPLSKPLLLAIAVMLGLSLVIILDGNRKKSDVQRVETHAVLVSDIGSLVHELQIERGLSAFYLGSTGQSSSFELAQQRKITDARRSFFEQVAADTKIAKDADFIRDFIVIDTKFIKHHELRNSIDAMQISARESFKYYSSLIEQLIDLEQVLAKNTTNRALYDRISTLRKLIWIKEWAGQIRALGSEGFSSRHLTPENHLLLTQLIAIQSKHRTQLAKQLSAAQRENFNRIYSAPEMASFNQLERKLITASKATALDPNNAEPWFESATQNINRLKGFEDALAADLIATAIALRHEMDFWFYSLLAVLCIVLIITVSALWREQKTVAHQRNLLQDSLRSEQERSQKILETMSEAVCVVGANNNIEYANPAMVSAFGKNIWSQSAAEILPCVGSKGCALTSQGLIWTKGKCDEALSPLTGRGYGVHCSPFRGAGGDTSRLVVLNDLTARMQTEQNLILAKNTAESTSRSKTEFLANMSHELRTPLNAIIGFSDFMLNDIFKSLGEDIYLEYARDINTSGLHLLNLINDILDVSAIESGKAELHCTDMDIDEAIDTAVRLIRPRMEKGNVKLVLELNAQMPFFHGDLRRFKQILLNLLSNATKFTPTGGTVTLRSDQDSNGAIFIVISDSGVGMTQDEIKLAMEEFGQADSGLDRKHEGTGLGLPLTKGLVELHDGELLIDSIKGKGTTITIQFPPDRSVARS